MVCTLGKGGRNTALAPWDGSLRACLRAYTHRQASAGGRSAALHSFELATASPALARLATHPVRTR